MSRIDEFITQGILPFAGREEETEKILAFWRSVPEAQHLRVFLLVAEAGVGKSRLLEECLAAIRSERGAVIHVKLYPEAANSLATLASRSIWAAPSGRSVLRSRPGENMLEVTAALQRLCRLRPTLLVLEDVHLFPPESIPDLVRLFEALVDETISVLCLSRPTAFAAQGVLERYLVESMTMEGLRPEGLAQLWSRLFGSTAPNNVLQSLHAITRGNGLAVRSGLRSAVQNGSIGRDPRTGQWGLVQPVELFAQGLRRSVSLVTQGMVAHLDKEKREVAERLAALGEVFARETAIGLDPRAAELLNELIEQGIVVETVHPVSPLAGLPVREPGRPFVFHYPPSDFPLLAFTHSLLHDYLVGQSQVDVPSMIRIIMGNYPLYSLVPLRLFETVPLPAEPDVPATALVLRRFLAISQLLDRTAQWQDGVALLRPLNRLLNYLEANPEIADNEKVHWRMHIQHASLSVMRRSLQSPEWIALHNRQMELTDPLADLEMVQYRMLAKSYELWRVGVDKDYPATWEIFHEVQKTLERYPEIEQDIAYVYVLESLAEKATAYGDYEMIGTVNGKANKLLADPNLPAGTRQALVERILPNLLHYYETPEELRRREESLPRIEEFRREEDPYYGVEKIQFLVRLGQLYRAMPLSDVVSHNAREHGLWMTTMSVLEWRIIGGAGIGYPLPLLIEETQALLQAAQRTENEAQGDLMRNPGAAYGMASLLTGQLAEIERLLAPLNGIVQVPPPLRTILALWREEIEELRRIEEREITGTIYFSRRVTRAWKRVAAIPPEQVERYREEIAAELLLLLNAPFLDLFDILTPRGTFHLWKSLFGEDPGGELKESLIRSTIRNLEWLKENGIHGYMKPLISLLEQLGQYAPAKEWTRELQNAQPYQPLQKRPETTEQKIRISMLGTIRVAIPPEEFAPIRGVRIRTLLGLMVAAGMVATPLSAEEFLSLAGGEESNPEHARKKKNMAVVRLREIIGHSALLTDGPTPRLNPDLVSVDLLEIDALIRRALDAARRDTFVRALPLIEEGLRRYSGEVPFPTLYENFFEAARNDFEYRLRQAVIEIGQGMIGMGDAAGAEPFLRLAFRALPGDEEIADLLRQALEGLGNNVDAERIRMRTE